MFKELKWIKFLLVAIIVAIVFSKIDFGSVPIKHGYCNKISFYPGDSLVLFADENLKEIKKSYRLYNLKGEVVFETKGIGRIQQAPSPQVYSEGLNYLPTLRCQVPDLPSGIYHWEKKVPIIIKSKDRADVTLVYPFLCRQGENSFGGKSFFGYNSKDGVPAKKLSLERDLYVTPKEFFIVDFFTKNFPELSLNVIADVDLIDEKPNTQLLWFYDNYPFATAQLKQNIDQLNCNVLVTANGFMNNQIILNDDEMIFTNDANDSLKTLPFNHSLVNSPTYLTSGVSHLFGVETDAVTPNPLSLSLLIDHPVFKDVSGAELHFASSNHWNGPPIFSDSLIDVRSVTDSISTYFKSYDLLAYNWNSYYDIKTIGGIVNFKRKETHSEWINLGSYAFVKEENLQNPDVKSVLVNAVRYLSQSTSSPKVQ
jgi:hypothetical protein